MQYWETARSVLSTLGMDVCCLSLSHEAPPNTSFDSEDDDWVAPVENHTRQGIEHAAKLGAECVYVVPPKPKIQDTLPILAQHYRQLAKFGQSKGVKIAIEHFPGTGEEKGSEEKGSCVNCQFSIWTSTGNNLSSSRCPESPALKPATRSTR